MTHGYDEVTGNESSAKDYPDPGYAHSSEDAATASTPAECDEAQGCGVEVEPPAAPDVTDGDGNREVLRDGGGTVHPDNE